MADPSSASTLLVEWDVKVRKKRVRVSRCSRSPTEPVADDFLFRRGVSSRSGRTFLPGRRRGIALASRGDGHAAEKPSSVGAMSRRVETRLDFP